MSKIPPAPPDRDFEPFERSWPRYWPAVSFPASPFLPGITPRSTRHAVSAMEDLGVFADTPLTADNWRHHGPYLFGVDLFNHGYWWEAHEQWEVPWRCGNALQKPFLQGLIQIAASLLKRRLGNPRGQDLLRLKGLRNLETVKRQVNKGVYMGLRLPELALKINRHGRLQQSPPDALAAAAIKGPMIILYHDA